MQPAPRSDYGGSGKLAGTTALITGGDSGFGRPLEPVAVAPSHILLASNDAIWMTGQVLHPNGGEIIGG